MTEPPAVSEQQPTPEESVTTAAEPSPAPAAEAPGKPDYKYTDADLDKFKGSARKDGRQAAINDLLSKAQGASSIDDLVAAWEEKRTVEEAVKTEAERLQEELNKAQARAQEAEALANTRLMDAELRTQLMAAGVPADRVVAAMRLVERGEIAVDNGTVSGVEEAVSGTLERMPWLLPAEAPEPEPERRTRKAPDAAPKEAPSVDLENMTDEQITQLADRVISGGQPLPVSTT